MRLDMNALREQTLEHLNNLWHLQYQGGGHKENLHDYVSIMGTVDAAWIYYMLQADEQIRTYAADATDWLLAQQQPDGYFYHDMPRKNGMGYRHSYGHAYWMVARALYIYGSALSSFPAYLEECLTPEGLDAWFARVQWDDPASNHHNVLGLVPLLASLPDPRWGETFFRNLAAQQNPKTSTWCDNQTNTTNVSRTFAYCAMHRAAGKLPPHPEKLIETILSIQRDLGIWETKVDFPEFHTMDAVYILTRLGDAVDYPRPPRLAALNRTADAMSVYFATRPVARFESLHCLLANLHTIGLLSEALPERFSTSIPWLFDWDRAEMFGSRAITERGKQLI